MMGLDRLIGGFELVDLLISGWIGKHKHHSTIPNKNPSLKTQTQTQISKDTDQKERALNKKIKKTKR